MNIQQLTYVIAVHKFGHFGQAADSIPITQATLSAMIRKLEEELGYEIFDRKSRPVRLTENGEKLVKISEDILNSVEQLYVIKKEAYTSLKGKLVVGVIPTIASNLLPLILPELIKENSELKLEIKEITTEGIREQLKTGKIDFGILATPLPLMEEFTYPLYYEPMLIYGLTNKSTSFSSTDILKDQKIWLLEEGHCFRTQSMRICNIKEKEMAEDRLKVNGSSFSTLIALAKQFGGLTLIPELYKQTLDVIEQQSVRAFQKPIPVREVSLISRTKLYKEQSANYLANFIREKMNDKISTSRMESKDYQVVGL
jgi:LysR family hydrogen peroxide-inducible transcriptional activator